MPASSSSVPEFLEGYDVFLHDLKVRIHSAQVKAALSVNREMIQLYLDIGRAILERHDRGRIRRACHDHPNLRQAVAEILWGHNLALLQKVPNPEQRV